MTILEGDALEMLRTLPDETFHCVVTSPPYWGLRDYGVEGQLGLEPTPEAYLARMVEVFREVRRVLRKDGTCWCNMGDSYAGSWGNSGSRPNHVWVLCPTCHALLDRMHYLPSDLGLRLGVMPNA